MTPKRCERYKEMAMKIMPSLENSLNEPSNHTLCRPNDTIYGNQHTKFIDNKTEEMINN